MKIRPAFRIEWERGPNKKATLKPYRLYRQAVFGFIYDASGNIIQSLLWAYGRMS